MRIFLSVAATASLVSLGQAQAASGPVDPSTIKACTYFDTAVSKLDNCQYFEEYWGISHGDFVKWNPSVKDDCSGLKVGNSYCIEVEPLATTTASSPTTTASPKPSPTQDGLYANCTAFYLAVKGDTCDKIVQRYGGTFTFSQFLAWNPAVGPDCDGLWAATYYCVGSPGTPPPPTTSSGAPTTTTTSKLAGPSPTQDGLTSACTRFYQAVRGDTCDKIVRQYGTFTLDQFYRWNPAVGSDCSALWIGNYYCVGTADTPSVAPSTTTVAPTPTGCTISHPTPTQPGSICGCKKWHLVVSGDTCDKIERQYGVSAQQFDAWNPQVGTDCLTLWAQYNVCVGV